MSDPVLDAHQIGNGCFYRLSGPTPISIRDQMLRGRVLVDRLVQAGKIHDKLPLIVFGAGVGGATAAVWAADKHKVRSVLVDTHSPFMVQTDQPLELLIRVNMTGLSSNGSIRRSLGGTMKRCLLL